LRSEAGCAKPRLRLPENLRSFCTGCGLTVPNSNGHQRRLPTKQHKTLEFPPTSGGNQGPCRDAGVGAIAPGFAMLKKASALHTLIHQRHPTPSCGGHAPTAERTMNPARMFLESLDRRPGIREQPGSSADLRKQMLKVCYFLNSGHSQHYGLPTRSPREGGFFLLKKLKILHTNQDHRSASSLRQRIDHPPPRRSDDALSSG